MLSDGFRILRILLLGVVAVLTGLALMRPAQAHAVAPIQGWHATGIADRDATQSAAYALPNNPGCKPGWLCCALAACPMVSLDLQRNIGFGQPLRLSVVVYDSPAVTLPAGLSTGPSTPPPRSGV